MKWLVAFLMLLTTVQAGPRPLPPQNLFLLSELPQETGRLLLNRTAGITNRAAITNACLSFDYNAEFTKITWHSNFVLKHVPGIGARGLRALGFVDFANGCALVSPRHFITASHIVDIGTPVGSGHFIGTNDVMYPATCLEVISSTRNPWLTNWICDIAVGILNTDLPPEVGFATVLPSHAHQYFSVSPARIPQGISFSQDNYAFFTGFLLATNKSSAVVNQADYWPTYGLSRDWAPVRWSMHDSGNPMFTLINGHLVLVGCAWAPTAASDVHLFIEEINATMHYLSTNNGVGSDYQLTVEDFTPYLP